MKASNRLLWIGMGVIIILSVLFVTMARFAVSTGRKDAEQEIGERFSKSLDLQGFDAIQVEGLWYVTVQQSDVFSVKLLSSNKKAEKDIKIWVQNNTLFLGGNGKWTHEERMVEVGMPSLESFWIEGLADVTIHDFNQENMNMRIEGAGRIRVEDSQTNNLRVSIEGFGDANLKNLVTTHAQVNLEGAGEIYLNMNGGILSGTLDGMGTIRYQGIIKENQVNIEGSGSIKFEA